MLICEVGLPKADVLAFVDIGIRFKRKPSVCAYLNSNISEYAAVQLQIHLNTPLLDGRQCWGKTILPRAGYRLGTYRTVDIFNFSLISLTILEKKRFLCFYRTRVRSLAMLVSDSLTD